MRSRIKGRNNSKSITKLMRVLILCVCASSFLNQIPERLVASAQTAGVKESSQSWKDWNYYQLLGLQPEDYYFKKDKRGNKSEWKLKSRRDRRKERNQITTKDIKKSYRKQAQAWHPDKIAARRKQQSNSTNASGIDYTNISVEECNSRFAKIAEAYEILSDDNKRQDYDMFLLDSEDEKDMEQKYNNKAQERNQYGGYTSSSSRSENDFFGQSNEFFQNFFSGDPMSTFENFFFGGNTNDDPTAGEQNGNNFMDDLFESFYGGSRTGSDHQQHSEQYTNRQPDRTFEKTEVRYDPRLGREVLSVFLKEEFDEPRNYRVYYVVTAQEFIQEVDFYGRPLSYSPISEARIVEEGYSSIPFGAEANEQQKTKRNKRRRPLSLTSHRLEKHEYITPDSLHLHSSNGEYYAGLTADCELIIMRDEGPFEEDTLFWTSNTYAPTQYRNQCALALYGARMAIIVGNIENPSTFLWSSPAPPPIIPSIFEGEESIDFYLSLDNDGSLVVYRSRIQSDGEHIDQCVYATGAGCNSAGRRFVEISKNIKRSVERIVTQLDEKMGDIIDSLNQESYDGTPLLTIVKNRIQRIKLKLGRTYALVHPKILNLTNMIRQYFQKVSSKVDEKVSGIMDSLYEIDEEDHIDLFDTVLCVIGKGFQSIVHILR